MSTFYFNEGKTKEIKINPKYERTKIYISINVIPENKIIKIDGFSRIGRDYDDVIKFDYPLGYAMRLYDKSFEIKINTTKIQIIESEIEPDTIPVTCKLILEAGDDLLEELSLDDKADCSIRSIFIFNLKFIKQEKDEKN